MQQRIYILLITLLGCVNAAWGQDTYNVVYLKNGATGGDGSSSSSPVGKWADAYKKLTNTGDRDYDWEHNIIVIVGDMQINFKETDTKDKSNKQGTAATITGVWPWDGSGNATTTQIKGGGRATLVTSNSASACNNIGSDTRFKNLLFYGSNNSQNRLSLRLHSTLFDTGLVMMNFAKLDENLGAIDGRTAPNFHIQFSFDHFGSNYTRPNTDVYQMPGDNEMTVTFKSGKYGRVAVSRTQGTSDATVKANYIQGTPEHPVIAHVIMDIQDGNDNTSNYKDDISILMGGSSQGLVCADLQYDIKHGTIGTLVAGTQGNNIDQCITSKIPAATFAGRTKINIGNEGGLDSDVTIQTYFGGTQGRAQVSGGKNPAYSFFYGESEFNMFSGTIKAGVFASATAFSGVGNSTNHTPDYAIPYVNTSNELSFSSYDAGKTMATIKSGYQGNVDLSTTKLTFNIHGGVIEGGIYGGSKGSEKQIAYTYAPDGAGTHFGNTYVNVYGGTIEGGVYGGGLGTNEYFDKVYETDKSTKKFLTVAQVYGNTNVNIYGGDIQGNIYGGGYGIATDKDEYLDIAKVYGTTNVLINPTDPEWTYTGNIYGGGALGAVDGDTNVMILGGIINGQVFGAGMGEDGHPDKAKVTGSTNVTVGESVNP